MLDAAPPGTVLDSEAVAQVFVRYACELELNEREVDLVMSNQSFTAIESQFLNQYVDIVRQRACERVLALSQNDVDSTHGKLDLLWHIWSQTVITPTLSQVTLLSSEGERYLRTVFATIVREFIGSERLVSIVMSEDAVDFASLQKLALMGLSEECNAVLATRLPVIIKKYVINHWEKTYIKDTSKEILRWIESNLLTDLDSVLNAEALPVNLIMDLAMRELGKLRITELYTLVERENREGLSDLAQALVQCRYLRDDVVRTFKQQCRVKLLNGGSDTVDIVLMYLKTISAFSIIDPQGVLLEKVSSPIRMELKERSDTSAKLAEGIFGEQNSPLAFLSQELQDQKSSNTNGELKRPDLIQQFRTWQPDPIDTPTSFVRKQAQDPVSTLFNLYDNKEVFVQQFMRLFGAELLGTSFDSSDTITRLERLNTILGQRFGESHMLKTGVMLNDVRTSHEIAETIHARTPELSSISALVLSRLYWPSLPKAPQPALPSRFQRLIDGYAAQFKEIPEYKNLNLHWLPHRGRVSVTLTMQERELSMVVKPHEAVLISAFEDMPLCLSELAKRTHLEEPLLLEAIQFWVEQLVLAPDGENYRVLETLADVEDQQRQGGSHVVTSKEVLGGQPAKAIKDPFEDMHVYWSYIVGMLTNLGSLPVDKIHSFLVMFVPSEDPYVKTKQELETYLLAMTDEGKLKNEDSKFSLVK